MYDIQDAHRRFFDAWETEVLPNFSEDARIWYNKTDANRDSISTKSVHIDILKVVAAKMYEVFPKPKDAIIPIVHFREIVSVIATKSPNPNFWHQKVGTNIRNKSMPVLNPQSFRHIAKNLQRYYKQHVSRVEPDVKVVKGRKRKFSGLDQNKLYMADEATECARIQNLIITLTTAEWKTRLPAEFFLTVDIVKKQAQYIINIVKEPPTLNDFEKKMNKLCLVVCEEWGKEEKFVDELADALNSVAAQSNDLTPLYVTILRQYSLNSKGKLAALFRTEAENMKMPHPIQLEAHIEYDKLEKGQYLFTVHVDKITLFRTCSMEDALLYLWCMIYIAKVNFPKEGSAVCYLLERYFVKLVLDSKHISKRQNIANNYTKLMERLTDCSIEDDFIKQIRDLVIDN